MMTRREWMAGHGRCAAVEGGCTAPSRRLRSPGALPTTKTLPRASASCSINWAAWAAGAPTNGHYQAQHDGHALPAPRRQRACATHYIAPEVLGAIAYLMGRAGARRIRFVESAWASAGPLEEMMLDAGWNVRQLQRRGRCVEFENTNALGKGKPYARFPVPGNAYMYPAYDLNQAFEETDVFVSLAKLKNHATCGVTLSLKNCFGNLPASIYGDDAGKDEPNEKPTGGRDLVGHEGTRQPAKSAPQELHFGANHDAGYRVPRIVADLAAARPIDLAIIDGVECVAGGEGPWIGGISR